ncbi:helix-turn-helix transcriptional regulator [Alteromonas sediminis]|nr:AlpA family phage regulatory protein [Alteromonas sediminis]
MSNKAITPRWLRMKQLSDYTGFSPAYLYKLISLGKFPASKKIDPKISVWERTVVDEWMDSQVEHQEAL